MRIVSPNYDVLIIGAGAAGLMCAIEAGRRGRKVALLDHSSKPGRKILLSGGGRCNFTNLRVNPSNFVSSNPDFCRSALSRFTPEDFIARVKAHNISYHEKHRGQLFCNDTSRRIVDMLTRDAAEAQVDPFFNQRMSEVSQTSHFSVKTQDRTFEGESLVIATGGLSIPAAGATDFGYRIAKQFGLSIVPPSPALDGFRWDDRMRASFADLAGVSLPVHLTAGNETFEEDLLFTHTGLSGPAALQGSLYWKAGEHVRINWIPNPPTGKICTWLLSKKAGKSRTLVTNLVAKAVPERVAQLLCELHLSRQLPVSEHSDRELQEFSDKLERWDFIPAGTVGYEKAEVTRGGVDTRELSSKTMEAKKVPGLYFIGEVLDVTGWLGGYNFQWAWASGWAAGQSC